MPSFQLRLAFGQLLFLIMVALVFILLLLSPFYFDLYSSDALWAQYASAEVWLRMIERGGVVIAVVIIISAFHHLVFSHRLCGPLVNMNHTLDAVSKGDISRDIFLRSNDFLKEEATKINLMLTSLNHRVAALKTSHAAISDLAEKLPSGPAEDQLKELLKSHNKLLDQWVLK